MLLFECINNYIKIVPHSFFKSESITNIKRLIVVLESMLDFFSRGNDCKSHIIHSSIYINVFERYIAINNPEEMAFTTEEFLTKLNIDNINLIIISSILKYENLAKKVFSAFTIIIKLLIFEYKSWIFLWKNSNLVKIMTYT